jgi:hypothetical protein
MGVNDHDDMLSNELIFAREGVASLLFRIPWPDQSPLYFLFLHVIRWIGESAFVLQFVNAVLLTMTLLATYNLVWRSPDRAPWRERRSSSARCPRPACGS